LKRKIKIVGVVFIAILILFFSTLGKTFLGNILFGNVQYSGENNGKILIMEDGKQYKIFRRLGVNVKNNTTDSLAVFKVRFKFSGLKPGTNKRLSIIPAPFLLGMKGFLEKCWMYDEESGYFQGVYQWESREAAESYPNSFIFKLMTKRSAKGTLSYEIIPNTRLSHSYSTLMQKGE
jgi:hypothetical protein